ncbi:hypothetical protein SETIT_2G054700v2 [Setaria italica]|uniref:ENT domain-containing protein n=1 Tax=Setaria italica TaxID=4555 RepID=A0A368PVE0_SETIT|nr:uncharacterized protein LOC101762906 isoform X2 [Setaria italica]RCV09751.1 hypothetical protein SETIT_2G054700v2 [Setaria italica]RCV09752.1 hypothetical protein SETIT_2G054700v2 [Setaria italica]
MMKLKSRRLPFYEDDHPHLVAQVKSTSKNMKEGVKHHQPVQLRRSRWVLGDVTEVLDHNSWRLGKITEVLKNDYFVIRLVDFIQPREFHISCLRIPHAYHSKQLTVADRDHRAYEDDDHNTKRKAANFCASTSARTVKRKLEASTMPPSDLVRRTGKKQKVAAYEVRQVTKNVLPLKMSARNDIGGDRFCRPLSGKCNDLAKSNNTKRKPDCKVLPSSEIPLHIREENECSVASCSVNYMEYCTNDDEQSVRICGCFPDDAMSACPSMSAQENNDDNGSGLHMNIHELELQAYQSTVRAFHAAGPLTWEQESLLTNLRLSLNISNEEHLLQLRHLLSL